MVQKKRWLECFREDYYLLAINRAQNLHHHHGQVGSFVCFLGPLHR
jgi:hypothetical protein